MAISTALTTLSYSTDNGTTYIKLVDILSYPDMGSTPSKLDTTDLSASKFKTSILGLQDVPDLAFECNYDKTAYTLIQTLTATYKFKLSFGATGTDGTFIWGGNISIFTGGGGVDEVRKMTVTLSASTAIVFA